MEALIIDALRIPRVLSKQGGAYANIRPVDLLKPLFEALQERHGLPTEQVEDVILGCNTQVGEQGGNLGKIAALYAGWSERVSGTTLNRFCCSSLDAANMAAACIKAGMQDLVVAGGVESISRVPMFSDKGSWFSDPKVAKATGFIHMGLAADLLASLHGFSREQLDQLALQSHQRAAAARRSGYFKSIIPMVTEAGPVIEDNAIREHTSLEKLASLPSSFQTIAEQGGNRPILKQFPQLEMSYLHTAATSPALTDGASLLLLASPKKAADLGLQPRAVLRHYANSSDNPVTMLTGHLRATDKLLKATGLTAREIDLYEVNESFASSVLAFTKELGIDPNRVNVNGSAIAMGHPLGATGGNLIGTLIDELERRGLRRGLVAIPGGAGVGVATLIERI